MTNESNVSAHRRGSRTLFCLLAQATFGISAGFMSIGCGDDGAGPKTVSSPGPATSDSDASAPDGGNGARAASRWTREAAEQIEVTDQNAAGVIDPDALPTTAEGFNLWDWWPVRDREAQITRIGDSYVAIALSAPDDILPGKRHDIARHRLLTSPDGQTWEDRGYLFPEGDVRGSRQWAGSAVFDAETNTLYAFYTASGRAAWEPEPTLPEDDGGAPEEGPPSRAPSSGAEPTEGISYEQRMVVATATVDVENGSFSIGEWGPHTVILEADGDIYEPTVTAAGGAGQIAGFRDPEYFRDPASGRDYLTFTANLADSECSENGVVGIAEAVPGSNLREWTMLPPLLEANCVNQELERPHFVVDEDRYYLFFSTHQFTFAEGLDGPEGLYGFVADSLFGDYQPLNQGGLVLANPEQDPYQAYSWLVLPNFILTSFLNYFDLGGLDIDAVGQQSPEFQLEHFGGVFAPSVQLEVDGDQTSLGPVLPAGAIVP